MRDFSLAYLGWHLLALLYIIYCSLHHAFYRRHNLGRNTRDAVLIGGDSDGAADQNSEQTQGHSPSTAAPAPQLIPSMVSQSVGNLAASGSPAHLSVFVAARLRRQPARGPKSERTKAIQGADRSRALVVPRSAAPLTPCFCGLVRELSPCSGPLITGRDPLLGSRLKRSAPALDSNSSGGRLRGESQLVSYELALDNSHRRAPNKGWACDFRSWAAPVDCEPAPL